MREVFSALAADARRRRAGARFVLLLREAGGLMRFALRERIERLRDWRPTGGGWHPLRELQWAWRGVRARGWRAGLEIGLLGVALAACTIGFSATDALLVRRVPYPAAERLANLGSLSPAALDGWRRQTDLFAGVHGHVTRPAFLVGENQPAIVDVADVTPGLIEMLGVAPRWGRLPAAADLDDPSIDPVAISEALARERFGDAAAAVGRRLLTTDKPFLVVGVMPRGFRFPAASYQVWRALDVRSRVRFVRGIARLAPGQSLETIGAAVQSRAAAVGAASGASPATRPPVPSAFGAAGADDHSRTPLLVIAAAALCLLLTACANVASLELAGAMTRSRTFGIRSALGASRDSLVRGSLIEGLIVLAPATLAAGALALWGTSALSVRLPERVFDSVNAIDLDARALVFMALTAAAAWTLVSMPIAVVASRSHLAAALRHDSRSAAASTGSARLRRALTMAEVALAVLLLAAGTLYARTYRSLVALDKGFDSANLAVLSLTLPTQSYPTASARSLLETAVKARLAARGDVVAVTGGAGSLPPSRGEAYEAAQLEIDGRVAGHESLSIRVARIDDAFFTTLGVPLTRGRRPVPSMTTEAVIDETMARAFWSGEEAVGRQFRIGPGGPALTVVGVASHVRSDADDVDAPSGSSFQIYVPRQPPAETAAAPPQSINDLPLYGFLDFAIRLRPDARFEDILSDIRAIDSRFRLRVQRMDDVYASRFEDTWLATSLVSAFAGLAFVLAVTGVYGVMSYLVAGRRREIGIRMALGADRADVGRLVVTSALQLVAIGTVIGIAGALLLARWTSSQFYGVSATDPATYLAVAATILVTALLATWQPARQAARVDPAVTLRAD